ncbi:MAG: hypothetical protein NZ891_04500 [bacterium]|nr:hypothetical protein [bacterium]MDW8163984.1 hypothetical protein [Candidatus Omnitrophota bacterium]
MIKSKMPFSIWVNGILLEREGEGDNKYHFYSTYSVKAKEDKNKVVVLLEIKDREELSFSVYKDFSVNIINKFTPENP